MSKTADFQIKNRGAGVVVTITVEDSPPLELSMSWISAYRFRNEMEMAVNFGLLNLERIFAEMFAREEKRRLAKEAKYLAKEWRIFCDYFGE